MTVDTDVTNATCRRLPQIPPMASHYSKWDAIADPDEEEGSKAAASQTFSVPDARTAKSRAEAARAAGAAPNPLDDLFTLGNGASAAEVREKMRALPAGAKQQLLDRLNGPLGAKLIEAARAEQPQPKGPIPKGPLVGKRVVLCGLQSRPELNGRRGLCVEYLPSRGRCAVRLDGAAEDEAPIALKPACLTLCIDEKVE